MSKKLTFNIDLTEYDITDFEQNPIVVWEFDYSQPPVGKAIIAPDKRSVTVEFPDASVYEFAASVADLPLEVPLEIAEGYIENTKELLALSLSANVPRKPVD